MNGATDGGDGVEVFEFDTLAERIVLVFANRDVDVAAELALFHIGVGDVAVDEDSLESLDVGEGFFGGIEVGLGDNLHEGRSSPIEVDQRVVGEVGGLGYVFLEVNTVEADYFTRVGDVFLIVLGVVVVVERHAAIETEGEVHLGGLVVLGHVGVEVVLAIPSGDRG